MSKLGILDMQGTPAGEIDLADELIFPAGGAQAVHDVVVAHHAGRRAGTASTLRKGEVAGSGKKPWRQKGTGRARAGYRQSPVWRGGGVAFGPHPRSYAQKIPRKVAQLAFRRVIGDKVKAGEVRVLQELALAEAKTKTFVALLKALKIDGGVLFVVDKPDTNAARAARNLPQVAIATARSVHTYEILKSPLVVFTRAAIEQVQNRLRGQKESVA